MSNNKPKNRDAEYKLFLTLYRQNENSLYSFALKVLPNYSIAEDVMQEATMTMWDKFDSFEKGTNFLAWSKQILKYKAIQYLCSKKTKSIVHLSDSMLEQLAGGESKVSAYDEYFEALHSCVDKLQGKNKEIVRQRYFHNIRVKDLAEQMNTTCNAVSKHIARIHNSLKKCISQTMKAWEMTNG